VNPASGKMKKPKVFVTEGKDVALMGACVFFTRADPSKAITAENIHRVRRQPFISDLQLCALVTSTLPCLEEIAQAI